MMENFEILYWHWLVLGIVLFLIEVMVPITFFLWLGISALFMGGLLYFFPALTIEFQLVSYGVFAILSLLFSRRAYKRLQGVKGSPSLNKRGQELIGHKFILETDLPRGETRQVIHGVDWKITGSNLKKGDEVEVVGVKDLMLIVK
jgi:membrane protein implicated in regulation of membrane protease activity